MKDDLPLTVRIAEPHERTTAISLLYPERSQPEVEQYVAELTAADSSGEFSLSHLHVAIAGSENGGSEIAGSQIVGTGLLSFAKGRVALIWPPQAVGSNAAIAKSLLMDAMLRCTDASNAAFGQTLLPLNHTHTAVLASAGMACITSLSFLAIEVASAAAFDHSDRKQSAATQPQLSFINYDKAGHKDRITELLAQTHIDSVDCPEVSKLLTASDLLDGHLATGQFRSDLSFVAKLDQEDVGIVILAEHPEMSSIELVYIGIVPSARRRGFGRSVMQEARRRTRETSAITMFLAVDQRNIAARLLYKRLGFYSTDEQEVWLYVPCRS